jgi:hypothetical protein
MILVGTRRVQGIEVFRGADRVRFDQALRTARQLPRSAARGICANSRKIYCGGALTPAAAARRVCQSRDKPRQLWLRLRRLPSRHLQRRDAECSRRPKWFSGVIEARGCGRHVICPGHGRRLAGGCTLQEPTQTAVAPKRRFLSKLYGIERF